MIQINNFQGDLSDISAKKEAQFEARFKAAMMMHTKTEQVNSCDGAALPWLFPQGSYRVIGDTCSPLAICTLE